MTAPPPAAAPRAALAAAAVAAALALALALAPPLAAPGPAHAQVGSADSPFEREFSDVKFLDAYFGTAEKKLEVSAGDRNVPLTVVFANVGTQDITGIRGQLSVPLGFSPAAGSGALVVADSDANSLAGSNFALTFFVSVGPDAGVGTYPASARVDYSRVRESGERSAAFEFTFRVTGDSSINMRAPDPFVDSLRTDRVTVEITNDGTAPASGVEIELLNDGAASAGAAQAATMSGSDDVLFQGSYWDIGNLGPGESKHIELGVYAPASLRGETFRAPMRVTYLDSHGETAAVSRDVDFYVREVIDATGDSVINMRAPDPFVDSLRTNAVTVEIANDGTAPAVGVDIELLNAPGSAAAAGAGGSATNVENVVIQRTNWDIGDLGPGETRTIGFDVYVPASLRGETFRAPMQMTYMNSHGDRAEVVRVVDFFVRGLVDASVYNVGVIELSGRQTVIGEIINEGNEDALFGFVTVSPRAGSNIAETTQFIDEIETDSPVPFNVPVEFDGGPRYGDHDVTITVRYKDSLRVEHFVVHNATVTIEEPPAEPSGPLDSEGGLSAAAVLAAVAAVAAAVAALAVRRRRRKRRRQAARDADDGDDF